MLDKKLSSRGHIPKIFTDYDLPDISKENMEKVWNICKSTISSEKLKGKIGIVRISGNSEVDNFKEIFTNPKGYNLIPYNNE